MADAIITALTAYTTPIATDVLPIVDVTANATKKITFANLKAGIGVNVAVGYFSKALSSETAVTITHGLGRIPRLFTLFATSLDGSASFGNFDGTLQQCTGHRQGGTDQTDNTHIFKGGDPSGYSGIT